MSPEPVLMWSDAIILAALALAATTLALWFAAQAVQGYLTRYRVRGLTREQIAECRKLAARYRYENGTAGCGPVSPPVDPVRAPRRRHPDPEETP